MKALDFIEADLKRERRGKRRLFLIPLILSVSMAALGLGARRDFIDAFTLSNLWPPVIILAAIGSFPWLSRRTKLALPLLGLVVLLSFAQPETPVSLAKFEPPGSFWPETLHCLILGAACSLVASALITLLVSKLMPTPNRKMQLTCALVSGLCGLAALSLHCMGPLALHTLIAHWGQALLIFPLAYAAQRAVFALRMKCILGKNSYVKNLSRLGD